MTETRDLKWFVRKVCVRLGIEFKNWILFLVPRTTVGGQTYRLRRFLLLRLLRVTAFKDNYEVEHDGLIGRLLAAKSGAFIDVGTNVGQTLLKLLEIDPERHYIGVEPQMSSALNVDLFIKDNKLPNHTILPIALAEKDGIMQIGTRFTDDTAASISLKFRPSDFYESIQYVPAMSGDSLMRQLDVKEVSLIKIDVEGGEIAVLRGFSKVISMQKPYVIFECLPKVLRTTMKRLDEETLAVRAAANKAVTEFFIAHGYRMMMMEDGGGLKECSEILADDTEISNYVAFHQSDKSFD